MVGFEALQGLKVKCLEQQVAILSTINFPFITYKILQGRNPRLTQLPICFKSDGRKGASQLHSCPGAAITKCHRWWMAWLKNRAVWSHPLQAGGHNQGGSQWGRFPSRAVREDLFQASLLGLQTAAFHFSLYITLPLYVCA